MDKILTTSDNIPKKRQIRVYNKLIGLSPNNLDPRVVNEIYCIKYCIKISKIITIQNHLLLKRDLNMFISFGSTIRQFTILNKFIIIKQ